MGYGADKMAQFLRELIAFPEDQSSVSNIHIGWLKTIGNSSSRWWSYIILCPHWVPHTWRLYTLTYPPPTHIQDIHNHIHAHTHTPRWDNSNLARIYMTTNLGLSILLQQLTIYSNVHVLRCIIFPDILINTWEKPNCKVTRYFCYFQHLHEKHTVTLRMGTNA